MKNTDFKKENLDLNEVFDTAIEALNRNPDKDVLASLIEQVLEAQSEIFEKAVMGPEEIEKLSTHQKEMAKIREATNRSKWDRLTTFSLGKSPSDESRFDVEKMAEHLNLRQEQADRLIKQYEGILKLLEEELEKILNDSDNPGRKKELRELYRLISN